MHDFPSRLLAEKDYGIGQEYNSFMLLVVDEGIGAGIIINSKLYHGAGGYGSEAGHTTININGNQCSCGNKGCLETYASIPNILKEAVKEDKNISSWDEIVDKAESGDESYLKIIEREARYLAVGIVNTMNLLELEAVILSGDINYKPKYLLEFYVNELPVTFEVTKASASDIKEGHKIIDNLEDKHPGIIDICETMEVDKGYDDTKLIVKLYDEYGIKPVIDIRNMWKDPDATRQLEG